MLKYLYHNYKDLLKIYSKYFFNLVALYGYSFDEIRLNINF